MEKILNYGVISLLAFSTPESHLSIAAMAVALIFVSQPEEGFCDSVSSHF